MEPIVAALFEAVGVLPYGLAEARATAALERQGQPIGAYDALVAGTALVHGLIVVSGNVRGYRRVVGLAVEDWRESGI
nr:type II toxin-antitoxin system VapC family toxin [Calidithermus timidus]